MIPLAVNFSVVKIINYFSSIFKRAESIKMKKIQFLEDSISDCGIWPDILTNEFSSHVVRFPLLLKRNKNRKKRHTFLPNATMMINMNMNNPIV